MKYILAANYRDYRNYLYKHKISLKESMYVDKEEKLVGREISESDVEYTEIAYLNPEYGKLKDRIKERIIRT